MGIVVPVSTLVFLLHTSVSHADSKPRVILVGGYVGSLKIPDSHDNTLNHWAEKNRFKVGDILEWKYDVKVDSVLQVTKEDYASCNATKPLKQFNDGDTKFELEHSGDYFFISGASDHCVKGEKITIIVLSERNSTRGCSDDDSPKASPDSSSKTPAPAPNVAVGLKAGSGVFLSAVAIGLAMA